MKYNKIVLGQLFGFRPLILLVISLLFLQLNSPSFAGSATWLSQPHSGFWSDATNWSPATIPNGASDLATFGSSRVRNISLDSNIEVGGVVFTQGASVFKITVGVVDSTSFIISGAGMTNSSGLTQSFVVQGSDVGQSVALDFENTASAGTLISYVAGQAPGNGPGAHIRFFNNSTAGSALLQANNSSGENNRPASGAGGIIEFLDNTDAGSATLTANGNGSIVLLNDSIAANAQVDLVDGGALDVSEHAAPGLSLGSLEGSGFVYLGGNKLTLGTNGLSTTYSGEILDLGGQGGQTGGSLSKAGTGTLTLTGASIYTGGTTVSSGALIISNVTASGSGTGSVNVNFGTLGGNGIIAGAVTIGTGSGGGAFLAPAHGTEQQSSLTSLSGVTFKADSTYTCTVKPKATKHVTTKSLPME
ncbi:MAG: autotransporter-associated beta strand repeat-containing protein [Chthoniobacterales bacterium]|nr:autotransporter-associated beta strand repeat-containing protein [Chthoniobacterales bacterium]